MKTVITYNGLEVSITNSLNELRKKISDAQLLSQINLFDTIMVTIKAADMTSPFSVENHQSPEPTFTDSITVPVLSLKFEFYSTQPFDNVRRAGIRALQDNSESLKGYYLKHPAMKLRADFSLSVESLGLYILSDNCIGGKSAGTWDNYEHTLGSSRSMSIDRH